MKSWRSSVRRAALPALLGCLAVGSAEAKTKLTIGTFEPPDVWKQAYGNQMDEFLKNNPDIELDVVLIAGHGEYASKIAVLAATGSLPDILKIPPEQVAPIVAGGILEDLRGWFNRDRSADTRAWLPGALNAMTFQGQMFGVPAYVVNYAFGYNRDILTQRGLITPGPNDFVSWGQIGDIARKATQDTNGDGTPEIWGYHHGNSYTEIIPLILQAGGRIFDEKGLLAIDAPPTYEGLNWLLELMNLRLHGGDSVQFREGKVATRRVGSWEMKYLIQAKAPIAIAGGIEHKVRTDVAYVTSFAMTKSSTNKDAAWRFLKYVTSKEGQTYIPANGLVPMRRDVPLASPYNAMLAGFLNALAYATPYPYHVQSNYIQSAFNTGMQPLWRRENVPNAVVPEVQRTINAYLLQQMAAK